MLDEYRGAPVSVEWTVPASASFLHLGIHNLPPARAHDLMQMMAATTADPRAVFIAEALRELHSLPEVLIVVNHPLWDEVLVGREVHRAQVREFLQMFGEHVHALELNGLRPWLENREVIELAASIGLPVVSGGDRHGLEPNANLNLTGAATFSEFVEEVRRDRASDVVFMNSYNGSLTLRTIHTIADVIREYPHFGIERQSWNDRVLWRNREGVMRPLSQCFGGEVPGVVRLFVRLISILENKSLREALRWSASRFSPTPSMR